MADAESLKKCGFQPRVNGKKDRQMSSQGMLEGADIILKALVDQGVDTIFGYPGGAVLPLYDALFRQNKIRHVLVRHEQGAVHAAEGYARSTGKPGVVLVTSGPGATNAITGLVDALMDSIPIVCLTGQVPTHLIGTDAFQEADTIGITRAATKHNYLVRDVEDLGRTIHEAFYVATSGRPGPVVIDLPKNIQVEEGPYTGSPKLKHKSYRPQIKGDLDQIREAVEMIANAKKPVFYTGGGIINSGPAASQLLREFVRMTGFPITSTLMGLGCYPASDKQWLGMLGMHGTYEANLAMHECDVMINIGARFDDRITGRLDAFSPNSKKIHVDIDRANINKCVHVDIPIVGDAGHVLEDMIKVWKSNVHQPNRDALSDWWAKIDEWRGRDCLGYKQEGDEIMPQYLLERLQELTKDKDRYITTEVGQHQMWAAQYLGFEAPNRWMTSGGLGTMGYGLPAAVGVQTAHPESLVVDISGDASAMMNIQEFSTAVQFDLPIKVFIMNNSYMGMVRQWQDITYDGRYAHTYSEALPDFVKLAEAMGGVGLRMEKPGDVDKVIKEMIKNNKPTIIDCRVADLENCFPMVPSGAAHNEMILGPEDVETDREDDPTLV
jgi:acetolactate synthase-1/2/3 large subunit